MIMGEMTKTPKIEFKRFKSKKRIPRLRVFCPCGCGNRLDIYADPQSTEIGGVDAPKKFWKRLFNRLLK